MVRKCFNSSSSKGEIEVRSGPVLCGLPLVPERFGSCLSEAKAGRLFPKREDNQLQKSLRASRREKEVFQGVPKR